MDNTIARPEAETPRPVLSVVTICLNDAPGLRATLESFPQLQASAWEHIIVDGGSTDGSWRIAQDYISERVWSRGLSAPDDGIYDAMNKGLATARGKFIWFVNAGDLISSPDVVDLVVNSLRDFDGVWAMGHVLHNEIGRWSTSLPFSNWRFWTGRQGYNHQGCIVATDFLRSIGGHELDQGFAADLYVLAKAASVGSPREIDQEIAVYQGQGFSSTRVAGTPLEFHLLRTRLLGLPAPLRVASACYAFAQIMRRHGLKSAIHESKKRARQIP